MKIVKINQVKKAPFESPLFTGSDVTIQELPTDSQEYRVNVVNFGKGVRNKFHSHSTEQILIITAGILIPADEKHWHGATRDSEFSHIYVMQKESILTQLEDS
jgi:quercetin dioxygenase-like cupin family protein